MGVLRKKATGEILAKTHPALEEVPGGSKRQSAEGRSTTAARSLPKAGSDDNSAWGQKVRDTRGMRKQLDGKAAGASAKGGLSSGPDARTAQSEIKRLNEEAASPASYLGPSFAQNRRYQQVKELEKNSGAYSLGTSLKGMAAKGMEQIAMAGGDALAFGEDVLLAPVEVLSGMQLGDLSDTAPMNTWAKSIRKEAEGVKQKYQANMEKGGTPARLLEEVGASVIAAVPQAAAAMLTGGGSAAAQTTAGLVRTAAAQASPGVGAAVARAAGSMAKNPLYWSSFARTVGGDYENALRDQRELEVQRAAKALISGTPYQPASENEIRTRAALYAIGTGLANAAVEVSGGLETLPGELKGGGAWAALRDSMAHEGVEEVIQGSLGRGLKNAVYDAGAPVFSVRDENAIFNPVTAMKEFAGGAAVGGILGGAQMGIGRAAERIGSSVFAADTLGIVDPAVAQDAGQRLAEITATPGRGHGNETMSGENTARSTSGPIQVGRVTTIKHPYQGPKPIQAPKADTTIQVNSDSVERTRSQINVAQEMAQAPLEKRRFKTILTELLEKTFHRAQGVEVEGVTFGGKPYLVDINQNIPGKVVSDPNLTAEKLTLLDILPEVVKQGEYVGSGEYVQHGDKKKLTIRFDYFETLVTIGEKPYIASFDVEVFPNTNNYRTHKLNEIELSPATNADPGPVPGASATETALAEDAHFLNLDSTITGPANVVKSGLGLQIDATDLVKLYQQLLTEASTAKRIETLAEYYRKYVGDPSGRGVKGVDSAAFQELEKAYREAMGMGQYDDEAFQELKRLYERYLEDPMEDED